MKRLGRRRSHATMSTTHASRPDPRLRRRTLCTTRTHCATHLHPLACCPHTPRLAPRQVPTPTRVWHPALSRTRSVPHACGSADGATQRSLHVRTLQGDTPRTAPLSPSLPFPARRRESRSLEKNNMKRNLCADTMRRDFFCFNPFIYTTKLIHPPFFLFFVISLFPFLIFLCHTPSVNQLTPIAPFLMLYYFLFKIGTQ